MYYKNLKVQLPCSGSSLLPLLQISEVLLTLPSDEDVLFHRTVVYLGGVVLPPKLPPSLHPYHFMP